MGEELWQRTGGQPSIANQSWPSFDPAQLRDDSVEMPIAIKGKVRGHVTVPTSAEAKALEELALADARVKELIAGKTVRKVIVVPGKMINIVTD